MKEGRGEGRQPALGEDPARRRRPSRLSPTARHRRGEGWGPGKSPLYRSSTFSKESSFTFGDFPLLWLRKRSFDSRPTFRSFGSAGPSKWVYGQLSPGHGRRGRKRKTGSKGDEE